MKPFAYFLAFACLASFTNVYSDAAYLSQKEEVPLLPLETPSSETDVETLFEIVSMEEAPLLGETNSLPAPEIEESIPSFIQSNSLSFQEEAQSSSPAHLVFEEKRPLPVQKEIAVEQPQLSAPEKNLLALKIDFKQVFAGSPLIYSVLLLMSMFTFFIWFYSQIHLRLLGKVPDETLRTLRNKLNSNQYDEVQELCQKNDNLFYKMLSIGIDSRRHGLQMMLESMKAEGKRGSAKFWQRIALLNDIAIIAPMLGLLGTVLGMFYAFYDLNRSIESVSALFDGLGISVGTTVAGLVVAILAMIFYSIARYRLVRRLAHIEAEAHAFASIIDHKTAH